MIKKKLNILLHILLSVLSLGLFFITLGSCSEASSFGPGSIVTAMEFLKSQGYFTNFDTTRGMSGAKFKNGINNNSYSTFAICKLKDNVTAVDNKIRVVCYWGGNGNSDASGSSYDFYANGNANSNSWGNNGNITTDNIEIFYSPNRATTNLDLIAGDIYDVNAPKLTFTPYADVKNLTIDVGTRTYTNVSGKYYNAMERVQWRTYGRL